MCYILATAAPGDVGLAGVSGSSAMAVAREAGAALDNVLLVGEASASEDVQGGLENAGGKKLPDKNLVQLEAHSSEGTCALAVRGFFVGVDSQLRSLRYIFLHSRLLNFTYEAVIAC